MSETPRPLAESPERSKDRPVSGVHNGLEALEIIYEPAQPKTVRLNGQNIVTFEGFRFGALGETGTGKTTLVKAVVMGALRRKIVNFVLAHDCKGVIPEYPMSIQLASPAQFIGRKGFQPKEIPFVSFRGDARNDITCDVEDVASLSLDFARKGHTSNGVWQPYPHLILIDEISEAATEGRKGWRSASTLKLFEQGRKIGVCVVWTTQAPRNAPPGSMTQSSSVALFRLTGGDRNYVRDVLILDDGIVKIVDSLPKYHFVLWQKGFPWDGKIYMLPRKVANEG